MKKIYTLVALLFCSGGIVTAQQLPFSSQYFTNMFTINPAFTGTDEFGQIFLSHRSQYAHLEGGPQTSYMSVDGKISDNIGLGLIAYHDQTDILSRTSVMANYSYSIRFSDNHSLRMGISAGAQNNTVDYDKALVVNQQDPILFNSRQNRTSFAADLGIAYRWNDLQVGVAIPQLLVKQPGFTNNTGNSIVYNNSRHFRGTLRYDFTLNAARGLTAYPLIMIRAVKGAPAQWDINAIIDHKKWGWFGVSYHSNYAVSISAGVRYKNLSAGYSHDIIVGNTANYSHSSSEFVLIYHLGDKWRKQQAVNDELKERLAKTESDNLLQQAEIDLLKKETDELAERVRKTEEALEKNQLAHDSIHTDVEELQEAIEKVPFHQPQKELDDKGINTGKAENYTIENNAVEASMIEQTKETAPSGYYIVVGAFGVKSNAYRYLNTCIEKGQDDTKILLNKNNGLREVFIYYTTNEEEALAYRKQFTETYLNIWVLKLK